MRTISLAIALLGLGTPMSLALAQTTDPSIPTQDDPQAAADAVARDAQAARDAVVDNAQAARDAAMNASLPSDNSTDPATEARFDKDGNPNFDTHGNYQGCHGTGCQVDNPDNTGTGSRDVTTDTTSHERSTIRRSSSDESMSFGSRSRGRGGNWSADSVLGKWTIGEKNGSASCSLTLDSDESFGLKRASTSIGCPDGFFSVNRWRAAGRDLQLTDLGASVIGSFRRVGPGRFEGSRVSDGAAMFMSR